MALCFCCIPFPECWYPNVTVQPNELMDTLECDFPDWSSDNLAYLTVFAEDENCDLVDGPI